MNAELAEIFRNKRSYASYFHFGKDHPGTELGVVTDWLFARYGECEGPFASREYRGQNDDPPDIVLIDHEGNRHGIEVTEFVDPKTTAAHDQRTTSRDREYTEEEFRKLVAERILRKSKTLFKGPTCVSKRLVIFSDEPWVAHGPGVRALANFPPVPQTFFDEVWFMIPPAVSISARSPVNPNCRIFEIRRC